MDEPLEFGSIAQGKVNRERNADESEVVGKEN